MLKNSLIKYYMSVSGSLYNYNIDTSFKRNFIFEAFVSTDLQQGKREGD